jgi:hypothetical protein
MLGHFPFTLPHELGYGGNAAGYASSARGLSGRRRKYSAGA